MTYRHFRKWYILFCSINISKPSVHLSLGGERYAISFTNLFMVEINVYIHSFVVSDIIGRSLSKSLPYFVEKLVPKRVLDYMTVNLQPAERRNIRVSFLDFTLSMLHGFYLNCTEFLYYVVFTLVLSILPRNLFWLIWWQPVPEETMPRASR